MPFWEGNGLGSAALAWPFQGPSPGTRDKSKPHRPTGLVAFTGHGTYTGE